MDRRCMITATLTRLNLRNFLHPAMVQVIKGYKAQVGEKSGTNLSQVRVAIVLRLGLGPSGLLYL